MRTISILNNQGVDLLRQGDLNKAADTLQSAIDLAMSSSMQNPATSANNNMAEALLMRSKSDPTPENTTQTADDHTDQTEALFTTAAGHPFSLQVGLPGSLSGGLENVHSFPPSMDQFGADCVYLQSQGLYLTWETLQETIDRRFIVEAVVNSFLLYNLGLVNQLQSIFGVGNGTCKEKGMAIPNDSFQSRHFYAIRSRFMYLKCRVMLDLAGITRYQATGVPLMDLLSMALYNNSAYAAFAEGQHEIGCEFFRSNEAYIYSLVAMPAFFNGNPETVAVMNRYMTNFLLNSFVLRKLNVAAAA